MPQTILDRFIAQVNQVDRLWADFNWDDIDQAGNVDLFNRDRYYLEWLPPTQGPETNGLPIEQVRAIVDKSIKDYIENSTGQALLIKAKAGVGKSTSAILAAQAGAKAGLRTLYLMPRHNYWDDIMSSKYCQPDMWYHWLPTDGQDPLGLEGDLMCRYAKQAKIWTAKGYDLITQCNALCVEDDHKRRCSYRRQSHVKLPIIAGVHNHMVTGMSISNYDLVIVDELPLGAFISNRTINKKFIDVGGSGAIARLFRSFLDMADTGRTYRGRDLLDIIGQDLGEILSKMSANTDIKDILPIPPEIDSPSDVYTAREWYLFDLLMLLTPEYHAWSNGLKSWLTRVKIDPEGLHLAQRSLPWDNLPKKCIVLDGTGRPDLYSHILNRPVDVVDPPVEMVGRIYQITSRMNGISTILQHETDQSFEAVEGRQHTRKLAKNGRDLLTLVEIIKASKPLRATEAPERVSFGNYNRVGAVTFKAAVGHFERLLGAGSVLHFGGNRGTNAFVDIGEHEQPFDCIIIAGTPAPPDNDMVDITAQLYFDPENPERSLIKPYETVKTAAGYRPIRTSKLTQYQHFRDDGLAPHRVISGFWEHPKLNMVYQSLREDEIRQALHRARVVTRDCDVWLLTSVPLNEPLAGVWDNPTDCLNIPKAVDWRLFPKLLDYISHQGFSFASFDALAEEMEISKPTARKWANSLTEWQPDKWTIDKDPLVGLNRGRPKKGLLRKWD